MSESGWVEDLVDAASRLKGIYWMNDGEFIACVTPVHRGEHASPKDNFNAGRCPVWLAWDDLVAALAKYRGEETP